MRFQSSFNTNLPIRISIHTLVRRGLMAWNAPLPPLDEQRRIVAYLDGLQGKVDALKAIAGADAGELDALLPSVLDKAFKGEL